MSAILKKLDSLRLTGALRFHEEALQVLQNYTWPGNIRELENVIERLAINRAGTSIVRALDISMDLELNGEIDPDDKPREILLSSGLRCLRDRGAVMRRHSKRQELDLYLQELAHAGGDVTKAAQRLGIKRTTLHMRIKRLQMQIKSQRSTTPD